MRTNALQIFLSTIIALAFFLGGTAQAQVEPANIIVDTLDDELLVDGDCSLREAIQASNTNAPFDNCPAGFPGIESTDVISFAPALLGQTIVLDLFGADFEDTNQTGDLDILDGNLVITGPGSDAASIIIDGAGDQTPGQFAPHRVFHVPAQATFFSRLEFRNLTIRNGRLERSSVANGGGVAIEPVDSSVGCTPLPTGNASPCLGFQNVSVQDNTIGSLGDAAFGGGVAANLFITNGEPGSIVVENSSFSGNSVNGIGAETDGGGLLLRLTTLNVQAPTLFSVDIRNSLFTGNRAAGDMGASSSGGGLQLVSNAISAVSLTDTEFSNNQTEGDFTAQGGGASFTISGNTNYPFTLSGVSFVANLSRGIAGDLVRGAGLNVAAVGLQSFTVDNSRFSENLAASLGFGAVRGGGAALRLFSNSGFPLRIIDTEFLQNDASGADLVQGGGLHLEADDLLESVIQNSRFSGNLAVHNTAIDGGENEGAGIFADISFSSNASLPVLNIRGSEVSDNGIAHQGVDGEVRPAAAGAGLNIAVFNPAIEGRGCPFSTPCVDVRNSTFSGNFIQIPDGDAQGAGIVLGRAVIANFNNVTLFNNESDGDVALSGGIALSQNALADMSNSIVAGSLANGAPSDCSLAPGSGINSLGHNFVGLNDGCNISPQMGDQLGMASPIDPVLSPLAFFGESSTRSHQPVFGSPVVDAADPNGSCESIDQNGVFRPLDGDGDTVAVCDTGAVELVADAPPQLDNPIANQTLRVGDVFEASLTDVFFDPEGGPLDFTVSNGDLDVVFAAVEGSTLQVNAGGVGSTSIMVTAIDEELNSTTQTVDFTVVDSQQNLPPAIISTIPDLNLPVQGEVMEIDLTQVFEDPEGDELLFEAISSDTSVVAVEISGANLLLIPGEAGVAQVVVTALDSQAQATSVRLKSRAGFSVDSAASGSGGGSGGGGCALTAHANGRLDPLLWLLVVLAAAGRLVQRRRSSEAL